MTLPLFDYQAQAADLMATRERFGLHDEMGIGKTATAIGTIDRLLATRGLVVCPAMLRENWMKEFKTFSIYDRRICKGANIHDFIAWSRGRFDVLLASYEQMTKWSREFRRIGEYIDFMVFDEAHYLKNTTSQRSQNILGMEDDDGSFGGGIVDFAVNAYHVTGTPMANDPLDVYSFLRFANAMDLPQTQFVEMFFDKRVTTYGARHTVKDEMRETLQALIYNNSIKRTHQQVGMYLPPIHLTEMLLENDSLDIFQLLEAYPHVEDAIILAIENDDMSFLSADYIAVIRRLVGKAKAVPYAELLRAELMSGAGKRVCFFSHTEALLHVKKHLERYGYGVVCAYGDTPERDRMEAVQRFQNDPTCMVFLGNIKVAGTGLTLTASCDIDMVESDWSPAGNAQALKRVHRYGQTDTVRARFITLANSIDVQVNQTVARKTAAIAEIEGSSMNAAPIPLVS